MSVNDNKVIVVYSKALFKACVDSNSVDFTLEKLKEANELLIFLSKNIANFTESFFKKSTQVKLAEIIISQLRISGIIKNFLLALAHNKKILFLGKIYDFFENKVFQYRSEIRVEVICAKKLSQDEINEISEILYKAIGKKAQLNFVIDCQLLSGIIIKHKSKVLDLSLKNSLSKMKNSLNNKVVNVRSVFEWLNSQKYQTF